MYQQLSFPSVPKLQSALRKEGITLSLSALKEFTSESGASQVLQPPPRYGGHITSSRIDDRWVADLLSFESRPAKRGDITYTSVLLCQDIFSRFLWAEPISKNTQVRCALKTFWTSLSANQENSTLTKEAISRLANFRQCVCAAAFSPS